MSLPGGVHHGRPAHSVFDVEIRPHFLQRLDRFGVALVAGVD
tara:strand:+ start:788 stop:913 length:126 start_codon:yes stop_codon:yes gene_type:complete